MTTAQDQQSRELLPCPFCGQQDAFVEQLDTDASVVICDARISEHCACLARGPVAVRDDEDEMQPGRNAAIAAWNRRAPVEQAARALSAGIEPVGYLIDWPDEPDLGHYFAEGASTTGRSQPLHTAAQVQAMGHVPPGWQAVPVEPTAEMMLHNSGCQHHAHDDAGCSARQVRRKVWAHMLAAAPRPPAAQEAAIGPCGQCKDARQPCQCSLDTILKERGLVAVNRESFQHMVTKIAAASAPACWCAACDSAASPFGIPTRMSLCPKCGDKRCPRAYHHDSDCFASPKEPAP